MSPARTNLCGVGYRLQTRPLSGGKTAVYTPHLTLSTKYYIEFLLEEIIDIQDLQQQNLNFQKLKMSNNSRESLDTKIKICKNGFSPSKPNCKDIRKYTYI